MSLLIIANVNIFQLQIKIKVWNLFSTMLKGYGRSHQCGKPKILADIVWQCERKITVMHTIITYIQELTKITQYAISCWKFCTRSLKMWACATNYWRLIRFWRRTEYRKLKAWHGCCDERFSQNIFLAFSPPTHTFCKI